jgi:hypothetical protein
MNKTWTVIETSHLRFFKTAHKYLHYVITLKKNLVFLSSAINDNQNSYNNRPSDPHYFLDDKKQKLDHTKHCPTIDNFENKLRSDPRRTKSRNLSGPFRHARTTVITHLHYVPQPERVCFEGMVMRAPCELLR